MAMQIEKLIREFRYNGVVLQDPNSTFNLVQVRDFYATVYPEIISADIEGPEQLGAKSVYTFRRAVGTKGCELTSLIRDVGALLHANWLDGEDAEFIKELQAAVGRNEVTFIDHDARVRLAELHSKHCSVAA
ncbi:PRTRC system protein C [Janthinobacterium sp. GMG2]|uniref:PRTRC system protein C n=1 Tax=Janthinobacterium sp. GMG2 TaxID=3096606 RepID=UPI0029F4EF16|nr:PRTRC system protein C [Janthinobacterium sp. GMG2]MDX8121599.1 PRTRC system protein C [Janthinobacterium sp. GMG2]